MCINVRLVYISIVCPVFVALKSTFTYFISLTLNGGYYYFQFINESTENWRGNMLDQMFRTKTQLKTLKFSLFLFSKPP